MLISPQRGVQEGVKKIEFLGITKNFFSSTWVNTDPIFQRYNISNLSSIEWNSHIEIHKFLTRLEFPNSKIQ